MRITKIGYGLIALLGRGTLLAAPPATGGHCGQPGMLRGLPGGKPVGERLRCPDHDHQ